jgi:hypothetical protein
LKKLKIVKQTFDNKPPPKPTMLDFYSEFLTNQVELQQKLDEARVMMVIPVNGDESKFFPDATSAAKSYKMNLAKISSAASSGSIYKRKYWRLVKRELVFH